MTDESTLRERSGSTCELCGNTQNLIVFGVSPPAANYDPHILICQECQTEIGSNSLNPNHWRPLSNTMWSQVSAVQVMAWRMLSRLARQGEIWAADLLEMLYLEEDVLAWAKAGSEEAEAQEEKVIHKDSNGAILRNGDTVVLIKDLDVKGGGFTAKRGTAVRNIALVENNPAQIEGRINGQQIVILTQYVKKSG